MASSLDKPSVAIESRRDKDSVFLEETSSSLRFLDELEDEEEERWAMFSE
jgi:hypothetical protein